MLDYVNQPIVNNYGRPLTGMQQPVSQEYVQNQQQAMQQLQMQQLQTPSITSSGNSFFKVVKDETQKAAVIPVDPIVPDMEKEAKKRGGRIKKETGDSNGIIRAEAQSVAGIVEDTPTVYTYMETTGLLHDTLAQIDAVNGELMQEFELVRNNRTMKGKFNTMIGLSENIGALIGNRIQVIKEMNATISKSNEMDYKKDKDRKAANANMDDDKYISDLYKSFMQNPMNQAPQPQVPNIDPSIFGSGVVRADLKSGSFNGNGPADLSYLNYMSNLTPQQNLMRYEGNSNVKQVVVFDAATGNKFFQYMDLSTMQPIPNVEAYDQMFMEDTTIDLQKKIAKNINLNETFPVVVINEGVTAQY